MRNRPTPSFRALMAIGSSVVTLALPARTASAAEETESKSREASALPEIVVTADQEPPVLYQARFSSAALFSDTPLIETPFSVGVYTEELIEDQRAFTIEEVLQNDPSISLQMPSGFYNNQNLGLRGFRVDNFVGYRVDGLPVTNLVSPYLDDKARVEVLKGPAGLRFGFMPPGGAINLVRKRPTQDFSTSLQFDADSFGSLYSQADVSDTVAEGKFGYRLVLAGDEFDSFYDNAGGDRLLGSLFSEWKPAEGVSIWASISGQDRARNGYYGPLISKDGLVLDTGTDTNTMQNWARNRQESFDAALGADIEFNDDWKLRTSFNYQDVSRASALSYASNVQNNGDFDDYGFLLGDNLQNWETWAIHGHIEGSFRTGAIAHDVVVGAEYRNLHTRFGDRGMPLLGPNNVYDPVFYPRPADPTLSWDSYAYKETGVFFTDTLKFTERFSALLGIRYGAIDASDYWKGALDYQYDQSTWSPTAALMYEPVENVHTYVTYTEGMQDGGLTPFRGVANPYEPLGVQHSEQWEVGVKTEFCDGRLSGELALFQIEQDLGIADPVTNIYSLDGLQRHRGVELAIRGTITEHLQAGAAAMLLDAKQVDTGSALTDGLTPQYVPEYQVNLWSVLDIPQVPGLALTANVRFVDGQYLDQREQFATGSYSVVDLGARYRFNAAGTDWTLRLNLQNVLDEQYYESGEFYPGDAGYLAYGAPVSANFSVQVSF